jgi:hypothetical protein
MSGEFFTAPSQPICLSSNQRGSDYYQSKDRQDTRSDDTAIVADSRRRGDRVKRREFITLLGGTVWPGRRGDRMKGN